MADRPRMVVVAGPSGSGKSTHFPVAELGLAYFNVDDRCAELNGGSYQAIPPRFRQLAQEECKDFIERCTMEGRSFAVETTLRTDVAIRQGEAAREAGFRLEMIFVATDAVDENVSRVARRGLDGGHCAPESQIREIYNLSLSNLPRAIDVFDEVLILIRPSSTPPRGLLPVTKAALRSFGVHLGQHGISSRSRNAHNASA